MTCPAKHAVFSQCPISFFALVFLAACGSSEPGIDTGEASDTMPDPSAVELVGASAISGKVGDGFLVGASVSVMTRDGTLLTTTQSDSTAGYDVNVQAAQSDFPLLLEARGGTDLVSTLPADFTYHGVVTEYGSDVVANLNALSTIAVRTAMAMPDGVTSENIDAAHDAVYFELNSGLSSLGPGDAASVAVTPGTVADILRASIALGETLRLTRDSLIASGISTDADAVIAVIASDLIDGALDGQGGPEADARITARTQLAVTRRGIDVIANRLQSNGSNALNSIGAAILQAVGSDAQPALEDLVVNDVFLAQLRAGVDAAQAVSPSPALDSLALELGLLAEGMLPGDIRDLIAENRSPAIDAALIAVAEGGVDAARTVNNRMPAETLVFTSLSTSVVAASSKGSSSTQAVTNRAPTISGTPSTTIKAGLRYSFTPVAKDPDGNKLTFSISNKPAWAKFGTETGNLYGYTSAGDIGTYSSIQIRVSDGKTTTSLPKFSIKVTAASTTNRAPTISGTPASSVTQGTQYSFTPKASDADGNTLTFAVSGKPVWAQFSSSTGRLWGTPGAGNVGSYSNIRITVSDGKSSAALPAFSIRVDAYSAGSATLHWTPPTRNTDGSLLTNLKAYRIEWGKSGAAYSNSSTVNNPGISSYVVENLASGQYNFVVRAINAAGAVSAPSNVVTKVVP